MADSMRQKIMTEIKAKLATITTANGYETNIGQKVRDWKTTKWEADELPGVTLRDTEETVESMPSDKHFMNLVVDIESVLKNGATTGVQARKVLADIVKAIGTSTEWPVSGTNLAISTYYRSNKIGVLQDQDTLAAVEVRFEVKYRLNKFDPYTNPGQ